MAARYNSRRQVSNLTESGEIGRFPLAGPEFLANGTFASLSRREREVDVLASRRRVRCGSRSELA
jgi:hypothetical protein